MLVHYAGETGSIVIAGRRVYGWLDARPATVIPWESYKANPKNFIQAVYTKRVLESMFPGQEFPNVGFTYYEIRFLDWEQMCMICKGVGLTTSRENKKRRTELRRFFRENC